MKIYSKLKGNTCFPFFILAIVFLTACNQKNSQKSISLYDETTFLLKLDEKETKKSPAVVSDYETILKNKNLPTIPLYKYIKHPRYRIFIGIVLNNEEITDSVISLTDQNKKGLFYIKTTKKGKKYALLAIANDSINNKDTALTYENITSRFIEVN